MKQGERNLFKNFCLTYVIVLKVQIEVLCQTEVWTGSSLDKENSIGSFYVQLATRTNKLLIFSNSQIIIFNFRRLLTKSNKMGYCTRTARGQPQFYLVNTINKNGNVREIRSFKSTHAQILPQKFVIFAKIYKNISSSSNLIKSVFVYCINSVLNKYSFDRKIIIL